MPLISYLLEGEKNVEELNWRRFKLLQKQKEKEAMERRRRKRPKLQIYAEFLSNRADGNKKVCLNLMEEFKESHNTTMAEWSRENIASSSVIKGGTKC